MATKVKICGLKTEATLEAALGAGADYIGLVFFPPSPRNVSPDTARRLAAEARGRAKIVALVVDPEDAIIDRAIAIADPDLLQLHGDETPDRTEEIRRRWGKPVMKAIAISGTGDLAAAARYRDVADLILFDAPAPADSTRPGGNGAPFDWRMLHAAGDLGAYMLSGGLTAENVAEAIRVTDAPIVDVSSGVEKHPGEKDIDLIRRFLRAAKQTNQ
jgi:phosphoribosylanthranilate isomerase